MKKTISLLLALVMVGSMFAGCSSSKGETTGADATKAPEQSSGTKEDDTKAPVSEKEDVITIMVPPVTTTYLEKMEEWAVSFNELYPHLTIDIIQTSWDDHMQKLSTMSLAGEAPDIAQVADTDIGSLVELGVGINVLDYIDADTMVDYDKNALDYLTLEGKSYALPLYVSIQSIGANLDMLKDAGVDVQNVQQNGWTFDEFITAIANGTKDDTYGFVFATSAVTASDLLSVFGVSAGLNHAFTPALKYSYTSTNMLTFLQAIEQMTTSGYMPNYGVDAGQRLIMCETGNAMIFGKAMPLFENNFNKNNTALEANDGTAVAGSIPVNYAFLPIPVMEGVKEACYGTAAGLMAFRNKNTTDEHLANVMLALDYLCSGDIAAYVASELYLDAVCESGRAAISNYTIEGRDENNLAAASREIGLVVAPPSGLTAEMSSKASALMELVIAPKFQALLAGEITSQQMYDAVCKAALDEFGEAGCETGAIQ